MSGTTTTPITPTLVQIVPAPQFHNAAPMVQSMTTGTTALPLAMSEHVYHRLLVVADIGNADTVYIGNQGSQPLALEAGGSLPLDDVSPHEVYAFSPTTGQTVAVLGYGNHLSTEVSP